MPLEPIPVEGDAQPFELQLDVFSGPLDLLLHLIEARELDVLTVPLSEMADAYVQHLANRPVPPAELADFVAVASQLILLKSRRLLPGEAQPAAPTAQDEPDEEELRRRLIEYRALRDAARQLGAWDGARASLRREPREADGPSAPAEPMRAATLADALQRLAAIPEPEARPPEVVPREVTIAMQIAALRQAMGSAGEVVLQTVLAACRSRTEISVTVLAMLELVRRRQATVEQSELFGPILVRRIGSEAGA
ncbi:MAG TPA: segregation/condensation protein A [Candidatus Limnocylindria bacterium]|nr:segregation/condensation protein A [Candidatus Limnocylindria bacterium]